ncbi:hypothetical protein [Sphingomonas sp. Leaf205]|uniref:hypothetical protein n=1 Tax=Sphingomonas sp. Leaf205 TaxID=2876551 RepID=UPI000A7E15A5|nr:hypothetical protein [Sphingomonas sp. Leaf205]
MRGRILDLACLVFALSSTAAWADGAKRSEVPIRQVVLSDGTRRYAVPIEVGGEAIDAGLDSGSVGLRVISDDRLDHTLEAKPGGWQSYGFSVGTVLEGPAAIGVVTVGGVRTRIELQQVRKASCTALKRNCPASNIPFGAFRIQGDGLPDEGFRAIFGIGVFASHTPNPLITLGIRRWIIRLPRPGETADGALILNPDESELRGFKPLESASNNEHRRNDAVRGCLQLTAEQRLCAPTILDTGAPGVAVVNGPLRRGGASPQMTLMFVASDGASSPEIRFETDQRSQGSRFSIEHEERVDTSLIRSGIMPYLSYDVLYDSRTRQISLRLRPPYAGGAIAR